MDRFEPRKLKDILASRLMLLLSIGIFCFVILIIFGLFMRAMPILATNPLRELVFSSSWSPTEGKFGLAAFIAGSLWVSGVAMIISVPLSILFSIYLSEYAGKRMRDLIKPLIDLLAGISPVIYGVWGMLLVVPFAGFSVLSGGIVLAVMVVPIMISISEEVIRSTPLEMREASLALGATKWETVKHVIMRRARPGVIAAIMLGLSRAFGETMAVLMVAGCALHMFPKSIFDPAYPLPALIANTYGEMMSIPLYDSAILMAALFLLIVTVFFNMIGWGILIRAGDGT